jgi:hypothetical protein
MRIDSSGNVGIGISPAEKLHVATTGASGTQIAARFSSSTDAAGAKIERSGSYWRFASQSNLYLGADYDNNSGGTDSNIIFETDASERMRIDSSGNLLVGTTDTAPATNNVAGIVLRSEGHINVSRDNGVVGYFNRKTSDGAVLDIRKDGTGVGSIGVVGGSVYIDGGSSNYSVMLASDFRPRTSNGAANNDAAVDLGDSSARWKDLYLSGGVYLGGTGAANLLDDYEEGTWTPTAADATSGGNTGTTGVGSYTKIGNTIRVTAALTNVVTTGMTAGNSFYVQGFPFASGDIPGASAFFTGGVYTSAVTIASSALYFMYDNGASALNFYDTDGAILVSDITSGLGDFYFTAIYQTA